MNLSFAESLRFKFHLKALQGIVNSGLFKGETEQILRQKLSILEKQLEDQAAKKDTKTAIRKKTEKKN